ncbi:hypothetical protein COT60_02060 [Candidatus Pacearchaeota archaeon CG09_land_8_20_14_0_10_30_9]|nr:MAG: hypothetical protein COT60_02060 [Candidatus Pacearchaeota archaeon CG09_land_8_20_14_0_10_30_9]
MVFCVAKKFRRVSADLWMVGFCLKPRYLRIRRLFASFFLKKKIGISVFLLLFSKKKSVI